MKHAKLHNVAHNLAASLASGHNFIIGYYPTNIYEDAAMSKDQVVTVDLLNGVVTKGNASESLLSAVALYAEELPKFCLKHDVDRACLNELTVKFSVGLLSSQFVVTVRDISEKETSRRYGEYGDRSMVIDSKGRIRRAS